MFFKKKYDEKLIENYLTKEEKKERTVKLSFFYLLPFVYIYLFLIVNQGFLVFGTRHFFYICLFLIIILSVYFVQDIKKHFLEVAEQREYEAWKPKHD